MESDEAFFFQCWALTFAPATQISLANGTRASTVHGWATVKLFIAVALLPISTVAPVEITTLDLPSVPKCPNFLLSIRVTTSKTV
ncbi:hypothetical protein TNCT_178281 [Trichonephila clavata]|uniref:Uncharacterized protein n=1 Tax=Trichonephila clavata TaxID=2740835 RepID=A0A8X6G3Z8_TRICU|nr:hypothetical protein TNCT_178281 [Trichonephila clavata]